MYIYFTFVIQYGMQFYWYLLENIKLESNKVDNFEALYCTMTLICVEMTTKEIVLELIRLALDMQVNLKVLFKCLISRITAAYSSNGTTRTACLSVDIFGIFMSPLKESI